MKKISSIIAVLLFTISLAVSSCTEETVKVNPPDNSGTGGGHTPL